MQRRRVLFRIVPVLLMFAACNGNKGGALTSVVRPDAAVVGGAADAPGGGGTDAPPSVIDPPPGEVLACETAECNASIPDLCCPKACTGATDIDCAGCGNGRIEAGEVCDPPETCPQSCPQLKCQTQRLKSEGTCAAVCVAGPDQTACVDGDECCPPGCTAATDRDCSATCGNATVEPGELCDPPESCPQACPARGCTLFALKDAGTCVARCVEAGPQTACQPDDGCCPAGCNAGNDGDCAIQCDNGAIEGKETCDPLASCPKECPADGCRVRRLINAGTCTAACADDGLETRCRGGDGCCPVGCNRNNDEDCPVRCGNGAIEPGETCDPISSCMQMERACVSNASTIRTRMGDAGKCTFTCREGERACGPADGACPPGCTPTMDRDCRGCGNGVVEPPETCDPPSRCRQNSEGCVSDDNTIRERIGDPDSCSFTCRQSARPCQGGDNLCPPRCTAGNDPDCRVGPGSPCTNDAQCTMGKCIDGRCCVADCRVCEACTGPGGTCVGLPEGAQDNVPAGACVAPASCDRYGACVRPACSLVVSPASRDFGMVALNASSAPFTFTVRNGCATPVQPAIRVVGEFAIVTNGCQPDGPGTLAPNATCTVAVAFRPTTATPAAKTGMLHALGAPNNQVGTASLAGRVAATPPKLMFSCPYEDDCMGSPSLRFGNVAVDQVATQSLTLRNDGGDAGRVDLVTQAPFVVNPTSCTLGPGGSCGLRVSFAPKAPGVANGSLSASGTLGGGQKAALNGTGTAGPQLTITPTTQSFGSTLVPVAPGARGPMRTFTVRSNAPVAQPLSVRTSLPQEFIIAANSCSNGLPAPAMSCSVSVEFRPTKPGPYTATLVVSVGQTSASATMTGSGAVIGRVITPAPVPSLTEP